jgi:acyl phosphate:glycerol-3-phosphate acyltransferase
MGTAVLLVAAYLVGSMPFGYWAVRLFRREDIRTKGSGNIGASNVWRVYGWRLGLPIVLLDVAKGFVPALLASVLVDDLAGALAGGAAMLGHARPLFLGFERGGKAVATTGGVLLGLAPVVALLAAGVWVLTFLVARFVSVASMSAALSVPVFAFALGESWPVKILALAGAAAVVFLHRDNIRRLFAHKEPRVELAAMFRR